jgi:putative effector of murein hydrolase/putative effector of murein hydrolase LrgA (UPF0299 family)
MLQPQDPENPAAGTDASRRTVSHDFLPPMRRPAMSLLGAIRGSKSQDFYVRTTTVVSNVSFEGFPFEVGTVLKDFVFVPNSNTDVGPAPEGSASSPATVRSLVLYCGGLLREDALRIAGTVTLLGFEYSLRMLLAHLGTTFPAAVAGLFLLFGALCGIQYLSPSVAEGILQSFTPAVVFFSRWLGLMFVPSLVCIPSVLGTISLPEVPIALALIFAKTVFLIALGAPLCKGIAYCVSFCQTSSEDEVKPLQKTSLPPPLPAADFMLRLLGIVATGLVALSLMPDPNWDEPILFTIWISAMFFLFSLALHLQRWVGARIAVLGQLLQPVLTTTFGLLALMALVAAIKKQPFFEALSQFSKGKGVMPPGAGDAVSMLLPAAVIAMAFGMFRSRKVVSQNAALILLMSTILAILGLVTLSVGARVLGLSPTLAVSLAPTTASTPFAMESTRMLGGGDTKLAATGSIIAGICGTVVGRAVLNALGVRDSLARGLALGGCSHGIATGMLAMEEPATAPFAATAFAFVGSITAILMSFEAPRTLVLMALGLYIELPFGE